jgi:hypothetical protein
VGRRISNVHTTPVGQTRCQTHPCCLTMREVDVAAASSWRAARRRGGPRARSIVRPKNNRNGYWKLTCIAWNAGCTACRHGEVLGEAGLAGANDGQSLRRGPCIAARCEYCRSGHKK